MVEWEKKRGFVRGEKGENLSIARESTAVRRKVRDGRRKGFDDEKIR